MQIEFSSLQNHILKRISGLFNFVSYISVKRWYPGDFSRVPSKKLTHRALDDIKESIEELKYYRETVFKEKK